MYIGIVLLIACVVAILEGSWFNLTTCSFLNLICVGFGLSSFGAITSAWLEERKLK